MIPPGTDTQRISKSWGGISIAVTKKSNIWGSFVALSVKGFEQSVQYVIVPRGVDFKLWLEFAVWLNPDIRTSISTPTFRTTQHGGSMNYLAAVTYMAYFDSRDKNLQVPKEVAAEIEDLRRHVRELNNSILQLESRWASMAAPCPNYIVF